MPHDKDTERIVLGTIIRYNEHYTTYGDILSPELFYQTDYAEIFKAVQRIIMNGMVTDINSIAEQLAKTSSGINIDKSVIVDVISYCSEYTLQQDIERLRVLASKRRMWQVLTSAAQRILEPYSTLQDELEYVKEGIAAINQTKSDGVKTFAEAVQEVAQIVNDNLEGKSNYLRTGFQMFDSHYLLRARSMTILAAFPAVGKTALAMNIIVNVARQGVPCAYYSLEMGKSELAARILARKTTSARILNARLTQEEINDIATEIQEYKDLPIYIDESGSADFIRTLRSIRNMVARYGVQLVVIDYLQIYTQTGNSSEESLGRYAREAKNIARELNIAVMLLSQLNRSAAHPSIRMLRGSGQIEESADNVVLIDRPEAYPDSGLKYEGEFSNESTRGTAKLILAKGRGVGTGSNLVAFDGQHTQFSEIVNAEPFPHAEEDKQFDWYADMK